MKVSVEKLPTSEAVLDVEVTWDEMQKASEKAYRKLVQQVDIQGFRRGRAPRSLLERRLGKEYIYQEGLDALITDTYRNVIQEYELTPIAQPKLDAPVFEMGQPYHFNMTIPIVTPAELGDYKSLHFERSEAEVTSEEVDKELESFRNRLSEWKEVERPAQYKDRVTVDLKLTSDEQQISDLKDSPFELTNERYGLFSRMDEQIVGMNIGETKTFSTTIPSDYANEKLRDKQADYVVTLHKIEEKQEPELDDDFAEKASKGQYTTMEDFEKGLSDNILENKKRKIRDELREQAINALIEQATITLHPLLIEEEVEDMEHQMSHMLENQRLSMEQYLTMMRKTREEYREDIRPDAEKRVKRQLVLDAFARAENVEVSADEIEALFSSYAQIGQELPRTENQIRALALSYRREKAITHLLKLTTDPDPDEAAEEQLEEERSEENALAAVMAGETQVEELIDEADAKTGDETQTEMVE